MARPEEGEPARIRAYASYDADRLDLDAEPFSQIGEGYFAVMIDQGQDMQPYQGFTPIAGAIFVRLCADLFRAIRANPDPIRADLRQEPNAGRCRALAGGWRDVAAYARRLAARSRQKRARARVVC